MGMYKFNGLGFRFNHKVRVIVYIIHRRSILFWKPFCRAADRQNTPCGA